MTKEKFFEVRTKLYKECLKQAKELFEVSEITAITFTGFEVGYIFQLARDLYQEAIEVLDLENFPSYDPSEADRFKDAERLKRRRGISIA